MDKQIKNIIIELKQNDYKSFDRFYEMTNRIVYYSIIPIVKDEEVAADLMQDVYLIFLNKIKQFKMNGNIYEYLSTIGRNLSINYYNKNKRLVHSERIFETIASEEVVTDESDLDILSLLDLLNRDQRVVVVLRVINKLKFREIAVIMEKPLSTVLWIHRQALKVLRRKVGDLYEK